VVVPGATRVLRGCAAIVRAPRDRVMQGACVLCCGIAVAPHMLVQGQCMCGGLPVVPVRCCKPHMGCSGWGCQVLRAYSAGALQLCERRVIA
jgi:hypothetical protein